MFDPLTSSTHSICDKLKKKHRLALPLLHVLNTEAQFTCLQGSHGAAQNKRSAPTSSHSLLTHLCTREASSTLVLLRVLPFAICMQCCDLQSSTAEQAIAQPSTAHSDCKYGIPKKWTMLRPDHRQRQSRMLSRGLRLLNVASVFTPFLH